IGEPALAVHFHPCLPCNIHFRPVTEQAPGPDDTHTLPPRAVSTSTMAVDEGLVNTTWTKSPHANFLIRPSTTWACAGPPVCVENREQSGRTAPVAAAHR